MLTGDMAKYQIQDRIREAEHARLAGSARADGTRRAPVVRRVGSGLLAAFVGRRRKATPTSAPVQTRLA